MSVDPAKLNWIEFGKRPEKEDAMVLADCYDLPYLTSFAAKKRDEAHGRIITYSRKVFIPLTQLCRDVCHYCTFAHPPKKGQRAYMDPEEILSVAEAGAAAGCKEALFTLGDKPELRYRVAREELEDLGHETTLSYLRAMALMVYEKTGLLPHLNPGVMDETEMAQLRESCVSAGIMLESISGRLRERGGCHYGSPDKEPNIRLTSIETAGRLKVPFTSGILIGIGETRHERLEAILALRNLHEKYGHLQEIIIQNFRAKKNTKMADWPDASISELRWSIAAARLIFDPQMNIQAPPNLSPGHINAQLLIDAGINDWGGVSPVTPDHVNPEAPWPHLTQLAEHTAESGKILAERLAIYPTYTKDIDFWVDPAFRKNVIRSIDSSGLTRTENWSPGINEIPPKELEISIGRSQGLDKILSKSITGEDLLEKEIVRLFNARAGEIQEVCDAANDVRKKVNGETVSYAVVRNINYTNVCYFKCQFCAFSKGKMSENLRGRPYNLKLGEIVRRVQEAWSRGASEVCMQGGIHPEYTGQTYLDILDAIKNAVPNIHVHAFSPLEVYQGAHTLGISVSDFLKRLQEHGLGSLPGTAAEILDDEIRRILCPDKLTTEQWLDVVENAHKIGLSTTATIMFGHVDGPINWARHLIHIRDLQKRTGGFTELVPLPFVHMEAPIFLKGLARKGPTWREAILMHAVSRLTLHPYVKNIQASWVKLGDEGIITCLNAGANDLGGTLMNETITRAAGAEHGQEMSPQRMEQIITKASRFSCQRTTLYKKASRDRVEKSFKAKPLLEPINNSAQKYDLPGTTKNQLYRPGLESVARIRTD